MPHPPILRRASRGFTIIEIIVILIIIALMMVIVVPHFFIEMKVRKAQRVKDDLVTLNTAIEHYALDNGKMSGFKPTYADLRKYMDPNTDIYRREGRDVFGETYGPFAVGARPGVPPQARDKLSGIVDQDFWSPFQ